MYAMIIIVKITLPQRIKSFLMIWQSIAEKNILARDLIHPLTGVDIAHNLTHF